MALVDQQKIRRSRTGLIAHDPARAQAGYTLFAPMLGDGTVFLVDMDGDVTHTWRPPFRPSGLAPRRRLAQTYRPCGRYILIE